MANDYTGFVALSAEGDILSGRNGADVLNLLYEPPGAPDAQYTNFAVQQYLAGPGARPILWERLTFDGLKQIQQALNNEAGNLPASLDPAAFEWFVARVDRELASQPSSRFTQARFASISRTSDSVIEARYGLGIDTAGTVHDANGRITAEQHVVPQPPGKFRPLSRADRLSLAAALNAFVKTAPPPVDPLWQQLAQDASK